MELADDLVFCQRDERAGEAPIGSLSLHIDRRLGRDAVPLLRDGREQLGERAAFAVFGRPNGDQSSAMETRQGVLVDHAVLHGPILGRHSMLHRRRPPGDV